MVYHNNTKECAKDWEDHFGCGKVFKFLDSKFKKVKHRGHKDHR